MAAEKGATGSGPKAAVYFYFLVTLVSRRLWRLSPFPVLILFPMLTQLFPFPPAPTTTPMTPPLAPRQSDILHWRPTWGLPVWAIQPLVGSHPRRWVGTLNPMIRLLRHKPVFGSVPPREEEISIPVQKFQNVVRVRRLHNISHIGLRDLV